MGELYGETDPNTFEWTDGLIATATRRFARDVSATSPLEDSSRPTSGVTGISQVTATSDNLHFLTFHFTPKNPV